MLDKPRSRYADLGTGLEGSGNEGTGNEGTGNEGAGIGHGGETPIGDFMPDPYPLPRSKKGERSPTFVNDWFRCVIC